MLKKILILFLLMCFNVCFAAQIPVSKQAQYKTEVESFFNKEIPGIKKSINSTYINAKNLHSSYRANTNKMVFTNKLYDYMNDINSEELYLYIEIADITNKYVNVENEKPATDFIGDWYDFITPYLNQCNISTKPLIEVSDVSGKALNNIYSYIEEVN